MLLSLSIQDLKMGSDSKGGSKVGFGMQWSQVRVCESVHADLLKASRRGAAISLAVATGKAYLLRMLSGGVGGGGVTVAMATPSNRG